MKLNLNLDSYGKNDDALMRTAAKLSKMLKSSGMSHRSIVLPVVLYRRLECAGFSVPPLEHLRNADADIDSWAAAIPDAARKILDAAGLMNALCDLRQLSSFPALLDKFLEMDLTPGTADAISIGTIAESKLFTSEQKFGGQFFTPRDVAALMIRIVLQRYEDDKMPDVPLSIYDPTCGCGGLLCAAYDALKRIRPNLQIRLMGQELHRLTSRAAQIELLIRGLNPDDVRVGDALLDDVFSGEQADYVLANPPFGTKWKKTYGAQVQAEAAMGRAGRFPYGVPQSDDAIALFLQAGYAKMRRPGIGRMGVIVSCSMLEGDGSMNVRTELLNSDCVDAVIKLPENLFANTSIGTYLMIMR